MGVLVGLLALVACGFVLYCLGCYFTDGSGSDTRPPLHPDADTEVRAILGSDYDNPANDYPMFQTSQTMAANAAAEAQVMAIVYASRTARGLPTYI